MSIVRNIDQDHNRQKLFQNLADFCQERNILVVAEGVETEAEMRMVVALGTDYLQGYYLAKPQKTLTQVPDAVLEEVRAAYRSKE